MKYFFCRQVFAPLMLFLVFNANLYTQAIMSRPVCTCPQALGLPAFNITFEIRPNKSVYAHGEPIAIDITLFNETGVERELRTPEWGGYRFTLVKMPEKQYIRFCAVNPRLPITKSLKVPPGGEFRHTVVNFSHWDDYDEESFYGRLVGVSPKCPLQAGRYHFTLSAFDLTSNTVQFDIQ